MGFRYLSEECRDDLIEHFAQSCPVALSFDDSKLFFRGMCRIIDDEIARVALAVQKGEVKPERKIHGRRPAV